VGKDKKPIEISLTISPVRDASGKIIGASITVRRFFQSLFFFLEASITDCALVMGSPFTIVMISA
jgi:hypothetical protein